MLTKEVIFLIQKISLRLTTLMASKMIIEQINLEWVTPKENAEHRVFPNPRHGSSRKIVQKTLDGNIVQIWDSIRFASDTLNIAICCISECCSGIVGSKKTSHP